MTKSTIQYWNTLAAVNKGQWSTIADTNGELEQLTLSMDDITGDYTRLTRFKAGADTSAFGGNIMTIQKKFSSYQGVFSMWHLMCG